MTDEETPAATPPPRTANDPLRSGWFRSLRTGDWQVDPEKWEKARENGELIGQCRRGGCDGYLVVDDPPKHGPGPEEYTARCLACDGETVAPRGRMLCRSGRHGEAMDFYSKRSQMLKRN